MLLQNIRGLKLYKVLQLNKETESNEQEAWKEWGPLYSLSH